MPAARTTRPLKRLSLTRFFLSSDPVPGIQSLVTKVTPIYPESARQQRQEGIVTLFAVIETDGSVQNATVIQTAGKDLDEAALTAVRQWRYSATMCGSIPIPVETELTVNFKLY